MIPDPVTLTIPGTPPLPNDRKGAHWGRVAAERAEWKRVSRMLATDTRNRLGLVPGDVIGPVSILLEFRYPTRRIPDVDNAIASAKAIVDGLSGVLIADDGPAYLQELTGRVMHAPGIRSAELRVTVTYLPRKR